MTVFGFFRIALSKRKKNVPIGLVNTRFNLAIEEEKICFCVASSSSDPFRSGSSAKVQKSVQ